MNTPASDEEKVNAVRAALPAEGLFSEREWLLSPQPFALEARWVEELDKLGHRLHLFNKACNLLYQLSAQGRQPRWIADYLDRGKPSELVEFSREKRFRGAVPRVIRPDLVLTEAGFTIAEIDTVPGGIGLTAWLNQTFAALGFDVIGGSRGMIDGFQAVLPSGDIVVSDEAATYLPEMKWLCRELQNGARGGEQWRVLSGSGNGPFQPAVYRFFELFDLANVPCARELMRRSVEGEIDVTPPFKPYLEEKIWFALFWMAPLREFWRRELGEKHWLKLQQFIPYTWIVDPTPLPQHGVIPQLEINDWSEAARFTQKQRELILKISGFSERAWGSRGVTVAQDIPQAEWKKALENAIAAFDVHPHILQRFHKGRLVNHPFLDGATGAIATMNGRVRLCPYYFIRDDKALLGGALATICPADKKLLHGMKDAILVPTLASAAE